MARSALCGGHAAVAAKTMRNNSSSYLLFCSRWRPRQGKFYQLWQETRQYCLADFDVIYQWLGTEFDVCYYESEVTPQAKAILQKFIDNGTFTLSEGAYGAELGELGFFMVLKSDGNTLYATKDLALAYRKFQQYPLDRSLYVVGAEQSHYFRQLFKTLELMGFGGKDKNTHLSYGLVRLKEGKMSSRRGNIVPFSMLQEQLSRELAPHLDKYRDELGCRTYRANLASLGVRDDQVWHVAIRSHKKKLSSICLNGCVLIGNTGLYLMVCLCAHQLYYR